MFSTEDNGRNYYPYEMSDEATDLNGIRTVNSSHLLISSAKHYPRNVYPNEISDEEE